MKITDSIKYVGVNDHQVDLFEGQYKVPNGMSYNSYVILDEKVAVMDTVDAHFTDEWLGNLARVLDGRKPDYLVVQHMEPDHAANVANFMKAYPETTVVANAKTFVMIKNFFELDLEGRKLVVENGSSLSLGSHTLTFVFAPMVHWPEVMVTYESSEKVLFSADGFGKFGALDVEEDWDDESRRYFIGIVGKYGAQVQALLKKAAALDISIICPLHGPVLTENLGHYIGLYDTWSSYRPRFFLFCGSVFSRRSHLFRHRIAVHSLCPCKDQQSVCRIRIIAAEFPHRARGRIFFQLRKFRLQKELDSPWRRQLHFLAELPAKQHGSRGHRRGGRTASGCVAALKTLIFLHDVDILDA